MVQQWRTKERLDDMMEDFGARSVLLIDKLSSEEVGRMSVNYMPPQLRHQAELPNRRAIDVLLGWYDNDK